MRSRLFALLFLLMAATGLPGAAFAGEVDDALRTFNARVLEVMKAGPKLGFKGRLDKFRAIVSDSYDITAITKAMLGPSAVKQLGDDMVKVSESYTTFSAATYAAQFGDWDGERFEVGESRPSTGGSLIVQSWIIPKTGDPTQIDYVMRQGQGRWRIIDVLFDGTVSQVAVRRSEFGSIYRAKGLTGLLETIEKQTAALEK
ncbi:organic solvent ABC transporter [Paramagnetospirillum kuznetsovii]|uniref:Organic solvent ABC transporter n=1 Tax=Paramagnetospirillum kuznetsovii TaxID=2053833 RepID=A0A364NTH8_9PROT|nr:ABC transporter substrate-binding protein [Paramagnetospirillum kuznetsovii]RAU20393.1 organic solvent ABC transporter [Paramagnetospirillum kuznetsovii]